jgi:hypothetical protein
MNVIIAIEFTSLSQYRDALAIAAHHFDDVDESQRYCILRERGLEAYTLRSTLIPFVAYDPTGAVLDGNVDLDTLDRSQWRVLRRCNTRHVTTVAGFESLLSDEDNATVARWPQVIEQADAFLSRKVDYVEKLDFIERLRSGGLTLPLFIKGSDKGPSSETSLRHIFREPSDLADMFVSAESIPKRFTGAVTTDDAYALRFQKPDWFCPYREGMIKEAPVYVPLTTDFITSEVMSIKRDELSDSGTREFRCFVFNGEVYSVSRYTDYLSLPVPKAVREFAQAFAQAQQHVLPIAYVVDVADTEAGYQVIELNQFSWSGRYLDNRPLPLYKAVHDYFNRNAEYKVVATLPTPTADHFTQKSDSDLIAKFEAANND